MCGMLLEQQPSIELHRKNPRSWSFKLTQTHTSSRFVPCPLLKINQTSPPLGEHVNRDELALRLQDHPKQPSQTAFTLTPWVHNRSMHASIM